MAVAGVGLVTAGSMVANIAAYLLHLPAGRWLGPEGYGEFAALLAAQLVLAVPALALQTVVAREYVGGARVESLRSLTYRTSAIVGVLALVAWPIVAWALGTGATATAAALASAPVLVLLAGEQGLLQGAGRFGSLGAVLAAAGVGKVVPAVVALALGAGPGVALAVSTTGTLAVALGARVLRPGSDATHESPIGVVAVLRASQVQLALIALTSLDLLSARIVLDAGDAGLYALGAVAAKAAFWLPQAVGVVLYPRMADPARSAGAVRTALVVLAATGTVVVLAALAASPLVPLLVGEEYEPVQSVLWLFAAQGACLAVVQGGLLATIARERTRIALLAWLALAVEAVLVFTLATTLTQLLVVAVSTAAVTAIVIGVAAVVTAGRD
ncbi:xylose transporter [Rhodococcus rhodnii LMG 5362]|uniref:Xylose transporter n=1 Tax=Rhodococcus rhodnii LMG 5362 TaxID=1273125 RepID=R7WQW7_9NOCA|nr:xylose transporter [Rhodococcus rhodnii LMG 5362]